jgi:hypothetical protein
MHGAPIDFDVKAPLAVSCAGPKTLFEFEQGLFEFEHEFSV